MQLKIINLSQRFIKIFFAKRLEILQTINYKIVVKRKNNKIIINQKFDFF